MAWRGSFCRNLGLVSLIGLLAGGFTPLPIVIGGWVALPPRVEPAQAIVLLGSRALPGGTLSSASLRRTVYALRLHRRGLAPVLLFSGPPAGEGQSEPAVRADLARELGIERSAVLTVVARTTREEAAMAAVELRRRGIGRILLVSESQHLRRAAPLFEQEGFEVLPAPDDLAVARGDPRGRLELMREILAELAARLLYRLQGLAQS